MAFLPAALALTFGLMSGQNGPPARRALGNLRGERGLLFHVRVSVVPPQHRLAGPLRSAFCSVFERGHFVFRWLRAIVEGNEVLTRTDFMRWGERPREPAFIVDFRARQEPRPTELGLMKPLITMPVPQSTAYGWLTVAGKISSFMAHTCLVHWRRRLRYPQQLREQAPQALT